MRSRALFVGRMRYQLPLSETLRRKWDAVEHELDFRVLASSSSRTRGDDRFRLRPATRLDGFRFWCSLPLRIRREAAAFRPDAIVAQSAYEGAAALIARTGVPVVVEIHGDWRTFARLYGSPTRRVIARVADALALWAVRRAAKLRTVSPYTTELARAVGREPQAEFPAYMELEPFLVPVRPLPEAPAALFIGVLEPYKNIDGLASAWRVAGPQVPQATLRIVGSGSRAEVVRALVRDGLAEWEERLQTQEVVRALDAASFLVLPSRSEGMGRVVIEAFLRGRPVIGSSLGGIRDLVVHDETGVLVEPRPEPIAEALVELLRDHEKLARLAANARAAGERRVVTPEEYAARMRELVAG